VSHVTYKWVISHINESCRISQVPAVAFKKKIHCPPTTFYSPNQHSCVLCPYPKVMKTSHITLMHGTCRSIVSHLQLRRIDRVCESSSTYEGVVLLRQVALANVTGINAFCCTRMKCVVLHIWMSHVAHMRMTRVQEKCACRNARVCVCVCHDSSIRVTCLIHMNGFSVEGAHIYMWVGMRTCTSTNIHAWWLQHR